MGYSKVTICNKALGLLSARAMLTFEEDTTEGELCRSQYDIIVRSVLEDHAWSFAIKRRAISHQTETPTFGYSYQFTKPADCIRILRVSDVKHQGFGFPREQSDWALESGKILFNFPTIYITYVYDNKTPDSYTSAFIDAVSIRLAAELSYSLTESSRLYSILMDRYNMRIERAITSDSMQGVNTKLRKRNWWR